MEQANNEVPFSQHLAETLARAEAEVAKITDDLSITEEMRASAVAALPRIAERGILEAEASEWILSRLGETFNPQNGGWAEGVTKAEKLVAGATVYKVAALGALLGL